MENSEAAPSVLVEIGRDHYRTVVTADGHTIISDESLELGGTNEGMNSSMLLLASLGSCTAITLRMYADRKKWPLERVRIELSMDVIKSELQQTTHIKKHLHLEGPLTEEQKARLKQIADLCPMHKILSNPVVITTNVL